MAKSRQHTQAAGSRGQTAGAIPAAPAALSAAEQLAVEQDRRLALEAARAYQEGRVPTAAQRAALRRHEQRKETTLRWQYYRSIPQKHWRIMSGRQTKVINEQASLYNIPFGGPVIDLPAVVRALHDFLARNARLLASGMDDASLLFGRSTPSLERVRRATAELREIQVARERGNLVDRALARECLLQLAGMLRAAGETLQRRYGPDALEIVNDMIANWERLVEEHFGAHDSSIPRGTHAGPA